MNCNIKVNLQKVTLNIEPVEYVFYVSKYGHTCVDGRTADSVVEVGRPGVYGGDLAGIIASLEALYFLASTKEQFRAVLENLDEQSLINNILDFYGNNNLQFYLHTDDHGSIEEHIGCGHLNTNVNKFKNADNVKEDSKLDITEDFATSNNLRASLVSYLQNIYKYLWQNGKQIGLENPTADSVVVKEVLLGGHNEQAVVVVKDREITALRNNNGNNKNSKNNTYDLDKMNKAVKGVDLDAQNFFVYNPVNALDVVRLQGLLVYKWLKNKGDLKHMSASRFLEFVEDAYNKQVDRTNKALVEPKALKIIEC